jgi:hypothetical protein
VGLRAHSPYGKPEDGSPVTPKLSGKYESRVTPQISGELLTASAGRTVEEMADLILSAVQAWASTQTGDLTVVVCDCH